MVEYHSAVGTSAWIDLRRSLLDSAVSNIRGKPHVKQIGGKAYWYDRYRLGDAVVDRYIGEDSGELRHRLNDYEALAGRENDRARQRSRLIRTLRAEGYLMADVQAGQALAAMARVGVFRLGGTLVGTQAFRCYEGELGVRIGFDYAAMTDDIDVASFERLSLALNDQVSQTLQGVFSELKFDPVPALEPGRVWKWRQTSRNTLVELLTPSFTEEEGLRDLPALGVSAQSLHHINYLISKPLQVPLLYRQGILIQIPRPERFAIHKLIVADRRREGVDSLKSRKDRAQATFLIEVLADQRPYDLAEAYQSALDEGSTWRNRIASTLMRLPETRALLDALPS